MGQSSVVESDVIKQLGNSFPVQLEQISAKSVCWTVENTGTQQRLSTRESVILWVFLVLKTSAQIETPQPIFEFNPSVQSLESRGSALIGTEYKVMLVMTPSNERSRLESTLKDVGYALELAEEGLFALSELERQKPDAIVCGDTLKDMTGFEFFEMLKDDLQLRETGFVLMSGTNAQMLGRGGDIQIPQTTGAEDVVNFVSGLIQKRDRSQARDTHNTAVAVKGLERPMEPPRLNSRNATNTRASEFGGTLEHFSLFDLLMLLTQTGKTGLLIIRLRNHEARLLLEEGKLYHAQYQGESGEAVLIRIFMEAERTTDSAFAFEAFETRRLPPEMQKLQSVYSPTDHVLLNVAIALDQHKTSGNS